ncbi:hypothetical protein HS088_TW11G01057 [Tripterygium wilfordii]|uniref:RING-type domain-containing protein n=1 Tax=Tripterygium wilfordii TaxID=458696 RepID=A0A7J7D3P1_TRIWF|nr:RING-H2 finger protein ATL80-like [Tripterygium wilfordii]KAF5740975.1 hypothetical protein HS088_TW11G01057 [Tripterygium wilfordii]
MTRTFRFLVGVNSSVTTPTTANATENLTNSTTVQPPAVDSDFVVILAAILCALICVLGLIAVARCAWLRRISSAAGMTGNSSQLPHPSSNKGLKKKILRSLPKTTFSAESSTKFPDCAICLAEFVEGDEIRVLPQCGHAFHVSCIDTWLGSHSSCPSCRKILVVTRCQKCGGVPGASSGAETEARMKESEDDGNRFLP